jgi:hypothetical protein
MTMTCPTPPAGDPYDIVVRDALARHLHLSRDDVRTSQRLREDLGLVRFVRAWATRRPSRPPASDPG